MAEKKRGLGRGLEALIPPAAEVSIPGVLEVPLESIRPNPSQPRRALDPHELEGLAVSIRENGIVQPLLVSHSPEGYQLIAGERRWRAARLAGLASVPVIVREVTPRDRLALALVENLQREDLDALEKAAAYKELTERFDMSQEEVARRVGVDRSTVTNTLRLLHLPEKAKAALLAGEISESHARALLALASPGDQEAALATVLQRGLNVRQTEELIRRWGKIKPRRLRTVKRTPQDERLEEDLRRALGTRVSLERRGKRGRLVIHFYSEEELHALYQRLTAIN